jgi:hypothetical protein
MARALAVPGLRPKRGINKQYRYFGTVNGCDGPEPNKQLSVGKGPLKVEPWSIFPYSTRLNMRLVLPARY